MKYKASLIILFVISLIVVSRVSFAANDQVDQLAATDSLNCTNSKTPVECIVQADKNLKALADEMGKAYEQRMAPMDDDEKAALKYQQERWLEMRASLCGLSRSGALTSDRAKKAGICLAKYYQGRIENMKYQCEIDEGDTVGEMTTWKEPWSDKVPAGFKIEQRMVAFVVTPANLTIMELRSLPLSTGHSLALLKYGYKDVAQCRVQDPDGRWWLAVGGKKVNLSYVPEDQTMTTKAYKDKVNQDNKQWREKHNSPQ